MFDIHAAEFWDPTKVDAKLGAVFRATSQNEWSLHAIASAVFPSSIPIDISVSAIPLPVTTLSRTDAMVKWISMPLRPPTTVQRETSLCSCIANEMSIPCVPGRATTVAATV